MNIVTTVAELLIAGGTLAAAWYAKRAADSSARGSQAQLFSQLMDEYNHSRMAAAFDALKRWHEGRASDFQTAVTDWAKDQVLPRPSDATKAMDEHRRLISHFFKKAARIVDEGMLEAGLRDEVVSLFGKLVMRDTVVPMDRALHLAQKSPSKAALDDEKRFFRVFFSGEAPSN